jgi:hypothetical protein
MIHEEPLLHRTAGQTQSVTAAEIDREEKLGKKLRSIECKIHAIFSPLLCF